MPLGLEVAGANRADMKLVEATLDSIPIERPEPTPEKPQHFLGDKGYDYPSVRELVARWGYTAHIPVKKRRGANRTIAKSILVVILLTGRTLTIPHPEGLLCLPHPPRPFSPPCSC